MVGKGIRSAEMVAGKGEVLIRGVRTCLIEKVTFEGGEGVTCVELPCDRCEQPSQAERTQCKSFKTEHLPCLRKVQGGQCDWNSMRGTAGDKVREVRGQNQ